MKEYLAKVEPALLFLLELTSTRHRHLLEQIEDPGDLVRLAADRGHEVTRDTLSEAMKILIDRKLEREGIPSWVRARIAPQAL
jgi:hypothetical protein